MIEEAYQTLINDGRRFHNEERSLNADSNNWLWPKYPANNVITEQESVSFVSENRFSALEKNYEEMEFNKYGCNEEENVNSCKNLIHDSKMKTKKQPSKKSKVIVAGNSIVKHVDQRKMSRNNTVKVRSFPGARIEDMHHYTTPLLWEEPSTLIIHSGTNNLVSEEPIITKDKLLDLKERIEELHPNTNVILSTDNPELESRAKQVNELLFRSGIDIVNNDNIKHYHLNNSKLHLKHTGTAVSAKKFIEKIRSL